jgi:hypothetical protein
MRVFPRRKRTWAVILAFGTVVVATLVILIQPRARAALRLVHGFSALDVDPRVWFERGAENMATAIATALPAAVARVESCQSAPFRTSFRIYVCASHQSFTSHIGEPLGSPVRGIAFPWDIWISPKAFSFDRQDTHREALTHELSHLHLGQVLGWWHRTKEVPSWFQEGLADWVADTGNELVSRREASEAIISGHRVQLDEAGRLPFPKRPESYGMTWPMFHAQSRMFVEYLRSRDPNAFARFVDAVVHGARFTTAFNLNFGGELSHIWKDFLQSVSQEVAQATGLCTTRPDCTPQNAITIELCLSLAKGTTTPHLLKDDHRGRSMVFGASWYAKVKPRKLILAPKTTA